MKYIEQENENPDKKRNHHQYKRNTNITAPDKYHRAARRFRMNQGRNQKGNKERSGETIKAHRQ